MSKSNKSDSDDCFFSKTKNKLVGIVGLLVVVSSLINAGGDIYKSIMNIHPIGSSENRNVNLREYHWDDSAVFKKDIDLKNKISNKEIKLSNKKIKIRVYKNADVFLAYGNQEQWFSADSDLVSSNFSLMSSVHAAELVDVKNDNQPFSNAKGKSALVSLDKINENKEGQSLDKTGVIEKSYLFNQTNNYHSSFSSKTKKYFKSYAAEEGYVFTNVKLDIETINHASTPMVKISDDKKTVTVEVSLKSGPLYDRWRGWIKADVVTVQMAEN